VRESAATDQEVVMATNSEKGVAGVGEVVSDSSIHAIEDEYDPELARLFKEREAAIQRILARRDPELRKQGIAAYQRDLPRLLAENRERQKVAYRGNEIVAFGATFRQLEKRLAKKGFTDWGELWVTSISPLEIDEDDEPER
jgi:hypothetical protein